MAQSLETIRNQILTSIFGRRLGLDPNDYLVGQKDIKHVVTDLTSASTATAIPAHGFVSYTGTSLATTTANAGATFLLSNPVTGVSVTVFNVNALTSAGSPGSTAFTMIRPSTAFVILSSEGTTNTTVNVAAGCAVTLTGLTTGVVAVTNRITLAGVIVNGTT